MQIAILLFAVALWAALHSWLASVRVKGTVEGKLGGELFRGYRLAYNVISFVSFAPIAWLMWSLPDRPLYAIPLPWSVGMLGVQVSAVVLAAVTLLQTGAMHFAGISQILGDTEGSRLSAKGFYGMVRHPLYLFGLMFIWFAPRMSVNQLALTIAFSVYFFLGALHEERRLVAEFGEAYETYRAETPMILPRLPR